MRTYAAIDKISEPEQLYRKWIIKPFTNKIITMEKLERGIPGSTDGLVNIYDDLVKYLENDCKFILDLTWHSNRMFNFLSNSIIADYLESIISKLPKIFSPAFPDLFHKNYTISLKFLDNLEKSCRSYNDLQNIRNLQLYKDFLKKWNLSIYFPLRFQEIGNKLETSFVVTPQAPNTITSNEEFVIYSSKVLWETLYLCWENGIYLASLAHRFLKLSLQLIMRYKHWIQSSLSESQSQEQWIQSLVNFNSNQWLLVVYDIHNLSIKITTTYTNHVCNKLNHLPLDVLTSIKGKSTLTV